ncbi:hypothetical protein TPHA_0J01820 [Tetrapisispora phaffii CBS 4417]|uniref:Acetyl-CoA transporter n=1 Tax=Tetrapisispora phaffii (strain ATCC 24235 / CBS 4417 / NBRC 1672 / NRRL Y-8282 / UCD 70-5) TaxID=1071381 RepID=G8BYR1_TETPH|nr:hypothetical protein TPHA_0J01820 [Tetrapisispora phaffii CBS 4417]CCE65003.1 hypothetical protein TPHA_0J01820 [Tetrapisispora phaffii CBS 4417]
MVLLTLFINILPCTYWILLLLPRFIKEFHSFFIDRNVALKSPNLNSHFLRYTTRKNTQTDQTLRTLLFDIMAKPSNSLPKRDLPQFYLLVALYFIQGIPIGLSFGTVPFLLKSIIKETTFTQLGFFSISTYPYSLKILWSPIVDSIYSKKLGRRRSWIIPIQLVSGVLLYVLGHLIAKNKIFKSVDDAYHGRVTPLEEVLNVNMVQLTCIFTLLIFLCATQDIAVDGWALTILSKQALSYAATAQTIGLNIGYFLSFTVFLSFNSNEFINKYFRAVALPYGWVSLGAYMKFAGLVYILITFYIIFFTTEHPSLHASSDPNDSLLPSISSSAGESAKAIVEYNDKELFLSNENVSTAEKTQSIAYIYRCFINVLKLKPVQQLALIHLVAKFAFQCNEAATNLKLLEKGFKREDLAVTVLIDFPFEIVFGYYVAKWSSDSNPTNVENSASLTKDNKVSSKIWELENKDNQRSMLQRLSKKLVGDAGVLSPWLYGFIGRLTAAILGSYVVHSFPKSGNITTSYFLLVIGQHLLGSFMQTVQFVGISSFHTRVSDPLLGGTYMTLLNTLSNFGGTWPRFLILWCINKFTIYKCVDKVTTTVSFSNSLKLDDGLPFCSTGDVTTVRDGYYLTNLLCVSVGIILYFTFLKKTALKLQKLPTKSWRCKQI